MHCLGANAQQPVFKNYGVKDGLPSSEVYFAMQDSRGYMWFCTDGGVSRFNGYAFENFTTQDGLSDNVVFGAFEDTKGRIWFRTLSGKLSYYYNDSIYKIAANSKIDIGVGYRLMSSLYVDAGDTVWCGMKYATHFYKIAPGYKVTDIKNEKIVSSAGFYIFHKDNAILWGTAYSGKVKKLENLFIKGETNQLAKYCCFDSDLTWVMRCKNKKVLFAYDTVLVQYEKGVFKKIVNPSLASKIIFLSEDDNTNIWVGLIKNGVYFFKDGDFSSKPLHYLEDYSISSVFTDNEGGVWFTTLEKGIFYIPSQHLLSYTAKNGLTTEKIATINTVDKEKLLLTGERGEIYLLKNNDSIVHTVSRTSEIITSLNENSTYTSAGRNGHIIYFYDAKKNKIVNYAFTTKNNSYVRCYFHSGENISVAFSGIFGTKSLFTSKNDSLIEFNLRTHCLYADKNILYFGTTTGLWRYDNKQLVYLGVKYPLLSKRIDDIKVDANGRWWFVTKGEGIIVKYGDSLLHITKKNGLISNLSKSIFIDTNNMAWISTNKGISKLKMDSWNSYVIENFSTSDGLISDEVNKIVRCNENLYVATNSGVTVFNPDKLIKNVIRPPVHINKFTVNNTSLKYTDSLYNFTYNQNFIAINFIGICYHKIGKLIYKYRLKGLDSTWHTTTNTSIQYTSLNPANYTFEVLAVTDDGIESIQAAILNFTIGKPFWLKWWFIALVAFTTLLIIVFIYNLRISTIKNTEREKTRINKQIADIELKALRAQMNPHFIFNSINSIQHFILDNDRLSAQKYLTKFARLIRNVMENSKYEHILLTQELQTLKLYIELEILRSSFSFTYELEVDENLYLEKIVIPPMVLQPYVENAILHGIVPLNNKNGKICIQIKKDNNYLNCIIDDNGIGRKQAQEYKAKKQEFHKSMGLSITKERLDILNQTGITKLSITIKDKYDNNGNALGTSVQLFIPIVSYQNQLPN